MKSLQNLEKLLSIVSRQENLIAEKDKLLEVIPCKFMDMMEDMSIFEEEIVGNKQDWMSTFKLTPEEVSATNCLLREPLYFYNSYI